MHLESHLNPKQMDLTWKDLTLAWQMARLVQESEAAWWTITWLAGPSRLETAPLAGLAPHSDLDITVGASEQVSTR